MKYLIKLITFTVPKIMVKVKFANIHESFSGVKGKIFFDLDIYVVTFGRFISHKPVLTH